MTRWMRPLVVFGIAGGASLVALSMTGGAQGVEPGQGNVEAASAGGGYAGLAGLDLLESTLYYVEESYVDPSRVDYEKMYVAALQAVEQRVPVTLFHREEGGTLLHLEAGSYRTSLQVPKVESRKDLQRELQRVAAILATNLSPSDIPMSDDDTGDPYAQIEYAMVNGALGTLDPHSRLLPPEASHEMDVDNQGEFGGLGITIIERNGRLTVEYPMPGTPAEKEDIRADDQIVRIDGVSTINMSLDEAVSRLRGRIGSPVVIEVMRDGVTEPIEKQIVRARIELKPVEGTTLDGGIGYVSILGFHAQVAQQLTDLLPQLERDSGGLKGLIIDLRDNPGGFLAQAEKVADTFLDHGVIVSQVDSAGHKIEEFSARKSGSEPKYPIAILVNASSASASEIVSGALRNNERAVIIGERTYGKGSVQNLHQFVDDSKLKLTISKYLTPGDKSIQAIGIPADIELVPSIVERDTDATTGKTDDIAMLYFRERAKREADADQHLEQSSLRMEDPAYSLRYWRPADQKGRKTAQLDVSGDYQVQFARDVLLAAPDARRADILAAAAPVVAKYEKQGDQVIVDAFTKLGIDWTDGAPVGTADLSVTFDLGKDNVLEAGVEEPVGLVVTNNGTKPIYRLSAIATFEGDYSPREFFFGKLAPGESKRYAQPVQLAAGHPTELTPVAFSFRDAAGTAIAHKQARLPVQGEPLPRMTWQATLSDAAPGGNGNGIAEVGEHITVGLAITNSGAGPIGEPFARVRNNSGRGVDITRGTVEPGFMRAADGSPCGVTTPGLDGGTVFGDPKDPHVLKGDPPKWAAGCSRKLDPGQTWTGSFELLVKEAPAAGTDGVEDVKLELGDAKSYDHASIMRAGFYTYFTENQDIPFAVGAPLPKLVAGQPPKIDVTHAPGITVDGGKVTISGVATDDTGLAHVEVWHANEKVFYEGGVKGAHVKSVPYTADLDLKPGLNTITILATDEDGFTASHSVVTFYLAPEVVADAAQTATSTGPAPELHRIP